ncbi:MAG: acyl-CoA reductase [Armatimonas sp.]
MGEGGRGTRPGEGNLPALALICAGNTPLLAWPAMLFAVKHSVPVFVKMSRDETLWPQLLKESVAEIDPAAGARIICEVWPGEDPKTEELVSQADAVIAYGSDATIERLKALTGEKPFLGFGHAVSVGIDDFKTTKKYLRRLDFSAWQGFAKDVLTFDQSGCLSPHAIFYNDISQVRERFSEALFECAESLEVPARTDFEEAALIRSWRTMAVLQGATVWGDESLRWTVVEWPEQRALQLIPCPGLVQLIPCWDYADFREILGEAKGKLSSIGIAKQVGSKQNAWRTYKSLGISRVCRPGEMQTPPLDWKNGGVDLEAWIANLER